MPCALQWLVPRQTNQFRALEQLKRDLLQNFKAPITPALSHVMKCMPTASRSDAAGHRRRLLAGVDVSARTTTAMHLIEEPDVPQMSRGCAACRLGRLTSLQSSGNRHTARVLPITNPFSLLCTHSRHDACFCLINLYSLILNLCFSDTRTVSRL